jgi:GTP-binding protein
MGNLVAIVGRPNVGKSTFFNRMLGMRKAIVDDVSGVTRDRQYGSSEWNGQHFMLIDTGGFIGDSEDDFAAAIRTQVHTAIEEADIILFLVDVNTGVTDLDEHLAEILHRTKKQILLVVNKVDNSARHLDSHEFWSLGFDEMYPISSNSGSGTGDLLDEVVRLLPEEELIEDEIPKFVIVGRPNAGKSSFTNALLEENRSIVTEIAGTTRDSVHAKYSKFGKEFLLIDTAGLRKKKNVTEDLEFYSVMRAVRSLENADICILMLDATKGIEGQDLNIFRLAIKNNKGVVILVNKWDLVDDKKTNTAKDLEDKIKERIAPFDDVPIVFISVLEKQRIYKAVDVALEVYENRSTRITTSKLNEFVQEIVAAHPPPPHRGHFISIKYATQIHTPYPAFAMFCNYPKQIKEPYRNYLENRFREKFNFTGSPVVFFFRQK